MTAPEIKRIIYTIKPKSSLGCYGILSKLLREFGLNLFWKSWPTFLTSLLTQKNFPRGLN